ncbi:MAG TPA: TonB-dependent receptor [Bacteroidales bacterium]|nr:TonB-dependent receptor [Bacteroidales bacterium]HPM87888.1 TonB-dependent receptor [Bacteroidales bacterium]HQM68580.1 TonB-dependent receptor [Bacteroidales bacterium]
MKTGLTILFFLFVIELPAGAQDKYLIDSDLSGLEFREFAERCEAKFPVKFFYRDEWISDLRVGDIEDGMTLTEVLDRLFRDRSLYYYYDDGGNIVITRDYAIKLEQKSTDKEEKYIPGIDYGKAAAESQNAGNLVVDIGNANDKNKSGNVILSGYITNTDTKEPVAGATVYMPKLSVGTVSNEFGFYALTVPRGSYSTRISFIGMKERQVDINLYGSGELNIDLKSTLVPLKETVISADRNVTLQRFEVGVERINIVSFKLMPTSMGESDIIRTILLIPGVKSVGEGSAGFNVRGGSADQNLILLYGAPVYNSSHFFGFFPAVNSDIIKDVTLYKGGIPGKYGGRISSVLDIVPREGNRKEFAGNAGISPITTHIVVEGPLKKDTCYYLLAGRTTYSNWILGLLEDPGLRNSSASFYDLNARVAYDLNKNDKIDLSAYYSYDGFRFNSDTMYKYHNNILSLKWRHFFSSRLFSGLTLNNSYYDYDISGTDIPGEAFSLSHRINSSALKADINWFPGSRNEFNFGADLIRYDVLPGGIRPLGDSSIVVPETIERQRALESAVYFEDKFILTEHLSLNAGIRLSSCFAFGPGTFYVYDDKYPRSISSITDTVSFGRSQNYRTYLGPEFRLSLNYRMNDNSAIKINYNRTRQYLHLLSNTISISPTDTWKLCDYYLKPQTGDQIAAGYYRMLNHNKIEASLEVYYKTITNMVDYKGGTNLVMNRYIERDLIDVEGKAYGLELMLRKEEGRFRWSAGYTYSRILVRSTSSLREEKINSGNWFPANYDKPHDLVLTLNYLYSRRMSLSASYNFSSGRPVTYPVAVYKIGDIVMTHFSERNKYRLPYYSRFDLSMKFSGNLKSKKIAHPNWIFSIYNLLGRQNIYSVYFKYDRNIVKGYMLSVFGRPIPSLTFNFDF